MATPSPSLPESLPPHELRNLLRKTLKATLDYMDSDEFLLDLEDMSEDDQRTAAILRGETYRTWRKLNNLQLDDIREQLIELEADLREATGSLNQSLLSVGNVARVFETTNSVLSIASRFLTPV